MEITPLLHLTGRILRWFIPATVLALLCLPSPTSGQSQSGTYTVLDVGRLSGTFHSNLRGVNDNDPNNVAVVGWCNNGTMPADGFYWSQSTGIMSIGVLDGHHSTGRAVNDRGELIGSALRDNGVYPSDGGQNRAVYFDTRNRRKGLIELPLTGVLSEAVDLNNQGVICGIERDWDGVSKYVNYAAYWAPVARGSYPAIQRLQPLPGGHAFATLKIRSNGDLLGLSTNATGNRCLVIWRNARTVVEPPLYDLPETLLESSPGAEIGVFDNEPPAADATASFLAAAGRVSPEQPYSYFLWRESGIPQLLQPAPGEVSTVNDHGDYVFRADSGTYLASNGNTTQLAGSSITTGNRQRGTGRGINNAGVIAGSYLDGSGRRLACIWTKGVLSQNEPKLALQDLNNPALTPNKNGFDYLSEAGLVTDRGNIFGYGRVAKGKSGTEWHTFVLKPNL